MSDTNVRVDGFQTYWEFPLHFNHETLYEGLKELGWARNCPQARSNSSALKEALQELVRQWKLKDVLVRPLENVDEDGYAVVHEEPGAARNDYDTLFTVKWEKPSENVEPYVVVTEYSHKVDQAAINQWFRHCRKRITRHSVAKMMTVIITDRLNGTNLDDSGHYWIPAESIDKFCELRELIKSVALNPERVRISMPEYNLTDPESVAALKGALVDDITYRRKRIEELASVDGVKKRALENRRKDAQDLHNRVRLYEGYFGEALTHLHDAADQCEKHVVDAALQEFPDFFGIGDKAKEEQPEGPMVTADDVTADDVNPFAIASAPAA
jgi:hypothetical protein